MYEKHEVVISGVAGAFPECANFAELETSSFQGQNLVTLDDRKWSPGAMNVPSEIGKLKNCFKFDQSFFGIHRKLCRVMDAHAQQSLERTYEAIYDAGIRPESLSGSKTAVIMSSMTSESEYGGVMVSKTSGHAMLGHSRCMQSNRISYYFNFKGPSFAVDCSWVGGLQALVHAQSLIANGLVDAAVVGATNLVLAPEVSVHYDGLQRLSHDGHTRSFSDDAEGYCRSDGVVVFFLQRKEDARRSYGSIVKAVCTSNMDEEKFIYSDYSGFDKFLQEFYSDLDIDYNQIGYIEADGCATLKTDAMELNCLSGVLGQERTGPLLVGSCKSRLGHTESASAFVSLASALLALKTGFIPPTISYNEPNRHVPDLFNGKLKVVTERTPLEGDLVAVNVFGVVSAYGHVLLRRNPHSRPLLTNFPADNLPRLLLLSGRDEQAMRSKFTEVAAKPVDEHFYAMNHRLHMQNYSKHLFRGYAIVGPNESESDVMVYDGGAKRPVWFVFSGMGSQWNEMGKRLLDMPVTAASIHRSHDLLLTKDIDLIGLITDPDPHVYDNILCAFVGIAAIQVALVDLLTALGITPDGIIGHSVGELGCSYADGCLTAEQVILAAYARGKASNEAQLIKGMMAAVGKGYKEVKDSLPEGIEVACHNSSTSCTLSGPAEIMETYVEQLKNQGVFARLVNVANIAYHSKYIAPAAPFLLKSLQEIIPEPKQRSDKWVSSSVPEANWGEEGAKYCSADYHTNNLLSYVLFEEASRHIPGDAICIEIAPHGLLQPILKRSLATCTNVALTNRTAKDNFCFLLKSLATLYLNGVEMNLSALYPPVEFPVPRETDYLHPLITWEHSELWVPLSLESVVASKQPSTCWIDQHLAPEADDTTDFKNNHKVNSVGTIPPAHCLLTVMEFVRNKFESKHPAVTFLNLKLKKHIPVAATKETQVQYLIQAGFGEFEVLYKREAYITGQAHTSKPKKYKYVKPELPEEAVIESKQIYDFLAKCGFCFASEFNNIIRIGVSSLGFTALLSWKGNFLHYLDGVFNLLVFYHSLEGEHVKEIDLVEYIDIMESAIPEDAGEEIEVTYNAITGELYGLGVRMLRIKMRNFIEKDNSITSICRKEFIPHGNHNMEDGFLSLCVSLILDNTFGDPLSSSITLAALDEKLNPNISEIRSMMKAYSEVQVEVRKPIMEELETSFELKALKGVSEHCVLVCCGDLEGAEKKAAQLPEHIPCFILDLDYKPSPASSTFLPIIYNTYPSNNIALLKKSTPEGKGDHFVLMPKSGWSELLEENLKEKKYKRLFMVFYYNLLSDISQTLQQLSTLRDRKELRLMFLEDGVAKWELESPQYLSQARKDLRASVGRAGGWGSLLEVPLGSPQAQPSLGQPTAPTRPLNTIRCREIEIVNLAFNLEQLVLPSSCELKVGLVEYSGLQNGQPVFGLGRLDEDYILHPDPILYWRKPDKWTFQQAASVPLFYSMSYLMLVLLTKNMKQEVDSLLIHCGHSCFSQAVIQVALSKKFRVITTCFNKEQKEFIKSKFPSMNDSDIFIMDKGLRQRLDVEVMKVTNWEGVGVVINTLSNPELFNVTIESTSNAGRYFQIGDKTINTERKLGMGVFMQEYSVKGINPENVLELEKEVKRELAKKVEGGLRSEVVTPLDSLLLKGPVNPEQAALTIMNSAALGVTRKLVIPVSSETPAVNGTIEKQKLFQVDAKKRFLIIGGARDLWFDLTTWLVAKGADKLFVIIDESQMSRTIQRKLNSFLVKHQSITLHLLPSRYIESAEACEKLMAKLDNGLSGNTGTSTPLFTFFITEGMEKELEQVDATLRKYSKDCGLVCLGLGAEHVVELRQKQGLHGVCMVPKRANIKNRPLLNVLDNVLSTAEPPNFVTFDHMPKKEAEEGGTREDSVLPASVEELVALGDCDDCTRLVEVPTECLPSTRAKGIQAAILIPGFKTRRLVRFASKLLCPAFLVQLPARIKSIEDVIPSILKVLLVQCEEGMLTLVGESWSGAVCLLLARFLEEVGRRVEIILLEAAPYTVRQWTSTSVNNSFITKYFPITETDDVEQVMKLKKVCVLLGEIISRGEGVEESAVRAGLVALISRLTALTTFSLNKYTLDAMVHLFRPIGSSKGDTCQLDKWCGRPVVIHVTEEASLDKMLDSDDVAKTVSNLALLEYKYTARPQQLKDIATTELILDAIYQTEGLTRH